MNIRSLFLSEVARRLLGFFAVTYLARVLGVDGFGIVMIGLTVLSYVSLTGSAGIHVLGTRNTARGTLPSGAESGGEKIAVFSAGQLVGTRLLNTVGACIVVAVVIVVAVPDPVMRDVILLTSASAVFHAFFLDWYFQGRERMGVNAAARTIGAAVYLVALVLAVHSRADLRWAAVASILADAVSTSYVLRAYRGDSGPLRLVVNGQTWIDVMRAAFPFGAGSVLGSLSANFPVIAVGILLGNTEAGLYAGANKLVFFLLMIDRILGTVLLPASVRMHTSDASTLHRALTTTARWVLLAGLPLCVGGMFLGSGLVVFVYGTSFAPAGPVFGVLVWYFLLTMLQTVYTAGLVATGGEREYRNVMVIGAAMFVVGVSVGLMLFGVFGGAIGVVLAEAGSVVLMARALRKRLPPIVPERFGRTLAVSVALAAGLAFLPAMHVLLAVAAGAAFVALASFGFKAVSWMDIHELVKRFV